MAASEPNQRNDSESLVGCRCSSTKRIEHHDDHAEDGEHDLRQDANVVDRLGNVI